MPRCQALKFGADYPLSIHNEDPRLGAEVPLLHRRRELLWETSLPDLLMNEDDPLAIGWEECSHHIHHGSADAAGTELWGRKHDHMRFTLRDRVGNTGLMQPGIRRFTRINLAQVADIAGDEITAPRCWRTQHRCGGGFEDIDAQACCLNRRVALLRQYLEAPGTRMHKGHLRDIDALHIGRLAVHMSCTVGMDVHMVPLLDDLQRVVESRRFLHELRLLVTDIVHSHDDCGSIEELVVLQEPEGKAILANHQLRGRDQYLERFCHWWYALICGSRP